MKLGMVQKFDVIYIPRAMCRKYYSIWLTFCQVIQNENWTLLANSVVCAVF